jgi:hypothetical protein
MTTTIVRGPRQASSPAAPDGHAAVPDPRTARARSLAVLGCVLCVASILGLAALQYFMPRYESPMGLNFGGAVHFREVVLGGPHRPLSYATFEGRFRVLWYAAWAGYALAVGAGLAGGRLGDRAVMTLVVGLGLVLAFFCPPSLSTDSYAYVAYGRMRVIYNANPYASGPNALVDRHDPTAPFVGYLILPSVYGPVWTELSILVVAALRRWDLWWHVVAIKLIAAAALAGAALAGRAGHGQPGVAGDRAQPAPVARRSGQWPQRPDHDGPGPLGRGPLPARTPPGG